MKLRNLLLIMVSITMLSCNSSDCNNGIQDGNETGIDCGGDCVNCTTVVPPSTTELQLEGEWYMDHSILLSDTTYYPGITCRITLSLDVIQGTGQHTSYGSFGICNYPAESGWWINSTSGYVNDLYEITLLTTDSLYLNSVNGYGLWKYYK